MVTTNKETRGPCWCYQCSGRKRGARTIRKHSSRARYVPCQNLHFDEDRVAEINDEPTSPPCAPTHDQQSVDDQGRNVSQQTMELIDAYDRFFEIECGNVNDTLESRGDDSAPVTVGMLVMMHLEWMNTFNCSENAAENQWNTLRAALSINDSTSLGKFDKVMKFVKAHQLQTAKKIEMCPCTETIYYDLMDPILCQKFPHITDTGRDHCEKCGLSRLISKKGQMIPRKYFWYLPYR
jgi:hypothetical protein